MSTIIKKRTLKEISNATEYSQNSFVAAKQFIHDERDVTPEQILMKNLAVLFPEIEEKTLREAYVESKRNVDATLGRLERLQKEIRERQKIELQHARASKDSQLEEQRIDSELKREMTGIDASLQVNLTLLGEQAQIQVSKAIEVCSTVRSREDLERVLKQLLNNVLDETIRKTEGENSRLKFQYIVAKKACHLQGAQLEKREAELGQAKAQNERFEKENCDLRELNKRLLRELERRDPCNDFTSIGRYPGQDIF